MSAIHNLTPALATTMAVNQTAAELRKEFEALGTERPVPFIVWKHGLDDGTKLRVQQLLSNNGTKKDLELLPLVESTLKDMKRGRLVRIEKAA